MNQKKLWTLFLGLLIFFALGYTSSTVYKLFYYWRLDKQVPLQSLKLTIEEKEMDDLLIQGEYQFNYRDNQYKGSSTLDERYLKPNLPPKS